MSLGMASQCSTNATPAAFNSSVTTPSPAGVTAPKISDESGFNPEKLVSELSNAVGKSENAATAYMAGRADPHTVVEALASAELAVETAVTLRNKVVEAYQELMRMPV